MPFGRRCTHLVFYIIRKAPNTPSVHQPSVSEVAAEVPTVVPVGPPVAPRANIRLPDRVLHDAQVIGTIVALARIE